MKTNFNELIKLAHKKIFNRRIMTKSPQIKTHVYTQEKRVTKMAAFCY